jgi:hypothetical protein
MSLGKKIIINEEAAGYDDVRLTGSPSAASADFVAAVGVESKVYYNTNSNPNTSWSNVTVGSSYISDLQWDGFTWIATTGNGIYQTSNSAASGGWVNVVSGGAWNRVIPTIGGNICIRGGSSSGNFTMAYTSNIDGSVSSSNWSTKNLGFIGYGFSATITPTRIIIGRRRDATGGPQYYYTATDNDWFLDSTLSGWEVTPTNDWEWGYNIAYDVDNDKYMGRTRSYGVWNSATLGGSTTANASGFGDLGELNFGNGYWTTQWGTSSKYKTTYNGSWSNGASATSSYNRDFWYNGNYWITGMSYASSDSQAIVYRTSITGSNSYVSASTLGAASGSYLRVCKPSVISNIGAWKNFGSASPTFAA